MHELADLPLFAPPVAESARTLARLQRSRLAAFLERREWLGATQDEAAVNLGIPRQTLCFRFRELEQADVIVKTDRKRPTLFGRLAAVYVHRRFVL